MEHSFIHPLSPDEIPAGNYEGWYWLSNETHPHRFDGGPFDATILQAMPFVIEAHLYDAAADSSISIRHRDGAYHIIRYDGAALRGMTQYESEVRSYIRHRLARGEQQPKLHFCEVWAPVQDPLCADMETLLPLCSFFIGFQN